MTPMKEMPVKMPISNIILDESIYPRENLDHKRINIFVENLRDGIEFDPIVVQPCPGEENMYRIVDGAHRWRSHKKAGKDEIMVIIKTLDGIDPLLYAAKMAIGPRPLTEGETKKTARLAFQTNPRLSSFEIGRAIGRSRQAVDRYVADLRAANLLDLDLKLFRLNELGIPLDRIAKRLGVPRSTLGDHLPEMLTLAFPANSDLSKGFTVLQVARKHCWPEPLVWSQALKGKNDLTRFKALGWGLRTWDLWNFNECDSRFGDEWPGRIPAQLIAHILGYFSKQGDLVFDPMAGGGVCADTCLAMGRRCWSLDMDDRPDTRPEIEPYYWGLEGSWEDLPILRSKEKPDLIIHDPPYFDKKAREYSKDSISGLTKQEYLEFLERFFLFLKKKFKKKTRLAFINADWRDFQNCPAGKENPKNAILMVDYHEILKKAGWTLTHIIQAPMSSERFNGGVVAAMQKKMILGVTSRYVMMLKQG